MRNYSPIDQLVTHFDQGLRSLFAKPDNKNVTSPADKISTDNLSETDKKIAARLMRVNHAGEIAAQGLYHGHSVTVKDEAVKQKILHSAKEEAQHLAWCEKRLDELDDQPSMFKPAWYLGSYAIGASVGILGDKWILGFISETEKQVVEHLDKYIGRLPENDEKSREILIKMREEEAMHDQTAQKAGAEELPQAAKIAMKAVSKIMTKTSYWI